MILLTAKDRPVEYFLLIAFLYVIILFQILLYEGSNKPRKSVWILVQLILLFLNLSWGVVTEHPLYFGGTDTFGHLLYSQVTLVSGHTIPVELDPAYAYFPLYHIIVSSTSLATGIDIQNSLFLTGSVIGVLMLLFLYLFVLVLSKNRFLALLSSFFLSFSPLFIYYSYYPTPRSAAFMLFIIFLYCLIRERKATFRLSLRILVIVLSISIILMHSATVVQVLAILLLVMLLDRISKNPLNIRKTPFLVMSVLFLAYWFYVATVFTGSIIPYLLMPGEYGETQTTLPLIGLGEFFWDHLTMSISLFFLTIGIDKSLREKNYLGVLGISSLLLLVFYVPNPIKQIEILFVDLGFYRFELFAEPFISIMIAVGFITFIKASTKASRKSKVRCLVLVFLIIFASALASTTTSNNASDLNKNTNARYWTIDDMQMIDFVETSMPANASIYSDYFVSRMLYSHRFFVGMQAFGLKPYESNMIDNIESLCVANGYVVFRVGELNERGKLLFGSPPTLYEFKETSQDYEKLETCLSKFGNIYDSGRHEIFYN